MSRLNSPPGVPGRRARCEGLLDAEAEQDRAEVRDYIAADDPLASVRLDQLFSDAAARLADFPMLGRTGKIPGTRELILHASYRLVYEIDRETVWVLALVHTARQWPPVKR